MRQLGLIIARDVRRAWQGGGILPVVFFLLVAILFPFAIGPDSHLLARVGGGVLWVAALLATTLPIDKIIADDQNVGVLDQMQLRGISMEWTISAKLVAHWLNIAPALMLAALPAAALLSLSLETFARLELALLIGTPALAALGVTVASLTAAMPRAGALAGLLMLPLATPVLIYGAGTLTNLTAINLLAAVSLFFCAFTPFVCALALRGVTS